MDFLVIILDIAKVNWYASRQRSITPSPGPSSVPWKVLLRHWKHDWVYRLLGTMTCRDKKTSTSQLFI